MSRMGADESGQSSLQPPEKRARVNPLAALSTANASAAEILAALEREDESGAAGVEVDDSYVRRVSQNLEKKQLKNREMRIKYADEPQRFMESELELNTSIQEMHIVATRPDQYGVLVEQGVVKLLSQLLAHENTDIVAAVCNLIQELTDVDTLNESKEGATLLIDELLSQRIIETVVHQVLQRMNEEIQDEAEAIENSLSIVENILDFRPSASQLCTEQALFDWLLTRATTRKRAFDANKLYASQLLHMLLQSTEEAKKRLVAEKVDGIDLLLRSLAFYKRHDPGSADEFEHMENLFDSLCASLLHLPNRQVFLDGEGLQLMNLMLREKKQSASGALKVLSYATATPGGGPNCDKFVEVLGLRIIFPLFMRTPPKVKRKDTSPDEHEEHVCSVLDALLCQCSEENRQRVLQKFTEHGFENIDRAVELFVNYSERVKKFVQKLSKTPGFADIEPEELYLEKLNNGLYTLERVSLVLAEVCVNGHVGCRDRAAQLFRMKMKDSSISRHLDPILRDVHDNLGDDADTQRQRLESLLINLGDVSQETNASAHEG